MNLREATVADINALHRVRMSVKENVLNNPALVTEADYRNYLTENGKGWLAEQDGIITGFAIIDTSRNSIWALFVDPHFEKKGIGKKLHDIMVHWHFRNSEGTLWLTTAPGTRAADFYRIAGWQDLGIASNGELKFEMTREQWISKHSLE